MGTGHHLDDGVGLYLEINAMARPFSNKWAELWQNQHMELICLLLHS